MADRRAEELSYRIAEVEQLLNLHKEYAKHDASLLRPELVEKHQKNLHKLRGELKQCLSQAAALQAADVWQQNRVPVAGNVEELLAFEAMIATSEKLRLEKVLTDSRLREHHLVTQLRDGETVPAVGTAAAERIEKLEAQVADYQKHMADLTPRREPGAKTARIRELEADLRESQLQLASRNPPGGVGVIQRRPSLDRTSDQTLALPVAPTAAARAKAILEAARAGVSVSRGGFPVVFTLYPTVQIPTLPLEASTIE